MRKARLGIALCLAMLVMAAAYVLGTRAYTWVNDLRLVSSVEAGHMETAERLLRAGAH